MLFETKKLGNVLLLFLKSETFNSSNATEISKELNLINFSSEENVWLDLSEVNKFDSIGLGILLKITRYSLENNFYFALMNPSVKVKNLLEIAHLNELVPIIQNFPKEEIK